MTQFVTGKNVWVEVDVGEGYLGVGSADPLSIFSGALNAAFN